MSEKNEKFGKIEEYFDVDKVAYEYIGEDHEKDYYRLIDILFSALLSERAKKLEEIEAVAVSRRGLIIDEELLPYSLLVNAVSFSVELKYSIIGDAIRCIKARETENEILNDGSSKLAVLSDMFGMDFAQRFLLMLALAPNYERKYEKAFLILQGENDSDGLTMGLAKTMYELMGSGEDALQCFPKDLYVVKYDNKSWLQKKIYPLECVYNFLKGRKQLPDIIKDYAVFEYEFDNTEMILGGDICNKISKLIPNITWDERIIIQLSGKEGDGRKFMLKQACRMLGKTLVTIDIYPFVAYISSEKINTEEIIKELTTFAKLNNSIIFFSNFEISESNNEIAERAVSFLNYIADNINLFVFSSSNKQIADKITGADVLTFDFPKADFNSRKQYWETFLAGYKLADDVDIVQMSNVYQYNAGQTKTVARMAHMRAVSEGRDSICRENIVDSVRDNNGRKMGSKAKLVGTFFEIDDLILDEYQKDKLMDACNRIKNKNFVQDEWGFGKKTPYGNGLSILLYGSPGVGKTMSVQIISKILGLDAYRIDLSQMVSKYIGETEKNLEEIFNMAKNSCSILFFDEADALFSKRTDVGNSNDKYANMETAYLLQKMEEHDGIIILASNNINNFDAAFQRRMQYIINISAPNAQLRLEHWKQVFPKAVPLDEDIDFYFIAEQFELSGSRIKSIAIQAAYFAAEDGKIVKPLHILKAIASDISKEGRKITERDLGIYAHLYKDIW